MLIVGWALVSSPPFSFWVLAPYQVYVGVVFFCRLFYVFFSLFLFAQSRLRRSAYPVALRSADASSLEGMVLRLDMTSVSSDS